jgi:phosphonate transport system permease protein
MEDTVKKRAWYVGMLLAAAALYVWSFLGAEFEWSRFTRSFPNAADFIARMLPPDTSETMPLLKELLVTVQMALLGTTFGALLSLPLGVAASRNLSPRWLFWCARALLNAIRAVPSVAWGLFFVVAVGLGPLAGVFALTFYTTGYLGKFYYETFESLESSAAQALAAGGANRVQVFQYAILPQSLPLLLNYTLFILEYSIRAATILGVVGAGGIGYYLTVYFGNFQYRKAAMLMLILLAVVLVMDWISARLRRALLEPTAQPAAAPSA